MFWKGACSVRFSLKSILTKDLLLLIRSPYPGVFFAVIIIILMPITSVYDNPDTMNVKIGVLNEDKGCDGIRYSVFLISEMDLKEGNFKSLEDAREYGESGHLDALIFIGKNFSETLHNISQGNISSIGDESLMKVYIFSKYPQTKLAIASKIKKAYERFTSSGEKPVVEYIDEGNGVYFSYNSSVLLISFIFSYFYTVLFVYKDRKGPFSWEYFRNFRNIGKNILSYFLLFYLLSIFSALVLGFYWNKNPVYTFAPLLVDVLGAVSLAYFSSSFIKKEFSIYYLSPIVILLSMVSSGVLGPESYVPQYLRILYEIFPENIEVFYGSLYHIVRCILISSLLLAYSTLYYLNKKRPFVLKGRP